MEPIMDPIWDGGRGMMRSMISDVDVWVGSPSIGEQVGEKVWLARTDIWLKVMERI